MNTKCQAPVIENNSNRFVNPRLELSKIGVREHKTAVALKQKRERARAHSSEGACIPSATTTVSTIARRYNVSSVCGRWRRERRYSVSVYQAAGGEDAATMYPATEITDFP
ncbi:hypothetical protein NDU88_000743 [Pleurodeles waltl]|uniref:Uncharacterized protein n=1 Tax=Pleurodeles waltl TaxID=8319 RepID=A0AAV7US03_PLEWA|nr:hypothetical protein NDU88_000743 [Pleurodeles waltl]